LVYEECKQSFKRYIAGNFKRYYETIENYESESDIFEEDDDY